MHRLQPRRREITYLSQVNMMSSVKTAAAKSKDGDGKCKNGGDNGSCGYRLIKKKGMRIFCVSILVGSLIQSLLSYYAVEQSAEKQDDPSSPLSDAEINRGPEAKFPLPALDLVIKHLFMMGPFSGDPVPVKGFDAAWRSPPDSVKNLSMVCRYFREIIWRKWITVIMVKASDSIKKLEECVLPEFRDSVE